MWLIQAGRGWGKTRTGAEWVKEQIDSGKRRIALVGPTAADCRDVMVEGASGILSVCGANRPLYEPSKRRVTWSNGALATLYSGEEPDRLRGPQHEVAWCVARGTPIETEHGPVPIEQVAVGDRVWTRQGLKRVLKRSLTNVGAPVLKITTEAGEVLRVTREHQVFVDNVFRRCDTVLPGSIMLAWTHSQPAPLLGLNGVDFDGIGTEKGTIKIGQAACSMSLSGNATAEKRFPLVSTSTTSMKTLLTTGSTTSNVFLTRSIPACTTKQTLKDASEIPLISSERMPASYGSNGNLKQFVVLDAASPTSLLECEHDSVLRTVGRDSIVKSVEPDGVSPVYDLTIEDAHEFFAGRLLVHNCDEPAAWKYPTDTWDMLMFGLRLGDNPRVVATTTPKPIQLVRDLLASVDTKVTRGRTADNAANLAPQFLERIVGKYEGTRLGRQELEGELLEDVPGALWQRRRIDELRVKETPSLTRIVVAIDPAMTSGEDADETGIVAAAKGADGDWYVLDDRSCRDTPDGWGRRAVNLYTELKGDRIVAEVNNGGEMVEHLLRTIDRDVAYKAVHASRGKRVRAEPIAALYEQGRVHHVGSFPQLEDQMCGFVPDDYDGSPDRVDALVWALTELSGGYEFICI